MMGTSNLVQNFVSGHNPGEKAVKSRVEDAAAFRSEKDAARVEKVSNTDLRLRSIKRSICRFCHLKILQFALAIYIVVMTFTPIGTFGKYGGYVSPSVGNIIDPASQERTEQGLFLSEGVLRAVIACNKFQMLCLSISRMSAFAMYPALVLVFVTKYRFTLAFLANTPLSMWIFQDMHELHEYCGWVIAVDGLIHTVFHLLRWADQGNLSLLFHHFSGISGFIIIVSTLLVCLPMMFKFIKVKISFEIRKYLHYFFVVFALAMVFHTTPTSIPNGGFSFYIFSFLIGYYVFDAALVYFFMTEKVETSVFDVIPSGVQLTMAVSESFQKRGQQGGYAYVCFPWVDRSQWHAFSLFENPASPRERQIFLLKTGDWTTKVHELLLQRDTVRPVWVQGPFPSPYSYAMHFDNQIMVAGGIGITPALSVIRAYKDSRSQNLIWAVKDPAMLEFFLDRAYLDHRGWSLIFYTGQKPLVKTILDSVKGTNVCIVQGRPNIKRVVLNIIYGIESGVGKPERYLPTQKAEVTRVLVERYRELDALPQLSTTEKLEEVSKLAAKLGFLFTDIVSYLEFEGLLRSQNEASSEDEEPLISRDESLGNDSQESTIPFGDKEVTQKRRMVRWPNSLRNRIFSTDDTGNESSSLSVISRSSGMVENMMKDVSLAFQPWEPNESSERFVKRLDPEILQRWGILYCGGANRLENELKKTAEDYQLDLHCESFAW